MNRHLRLYILSFCVAYSFCCGFYAFAQPKDRDSLPKVRHQWRVRNTANFQILYWEKFIDAEKIYQDLSEELNLKLAFSSPKVKVYIRQGGSAYIDLSKKKIVVANERQLRHELVHLLFYQVCPSAPMALQEGIARYMEDYNYVDNSKVELAEFLNLCSAKSNTLGFDSLEKRRLYKISAAWVGNLIEQQGIEKFKQFYGLCTHQSKVRLAYERTYQR